MSLGNENHLILDNKNFFEMDFSNKNLLEFISIGCTFDRCNFEKIKINEACFGAGEAVSVYRDCTFNKAKFKSKAPGFARFERCSFLDVYIHEFYCRAVEFVDCIFSGKIKKAFFNGAVSSADIAITHKDYNDFFGNDFSRAELIDVSFRSGIDLSQQKLPSSPDYVFIPKAEISLEKLKEEVNQIVDLDIKKKAVGIIELLQLSIKEGQSQLFISKDVFPRGQMEIVKMLFDRLKNNRLT